MINIQTECHDLHLSQRYCKWRLIEQIRKENSTAINQSPSTVKRKSPPRNADNLSPRQFASIRYQPLSSNRQSMVPQGALCLPNRGFYSSTFGLHRSSVRLETWPAHFYLSILILHVMSVTLVLCWKTSIQILSDRETSTQKQQRERKLETSSVLSLWLGGRRPKPDFWVEA